MVVGQGGLWLTSIVELATVVGCREQGDQLSLRKELVTILNNLVDIRVKIEFLKIRNLFFIPGELCISSRSRVCEGTWQPPSRKSGCQREFQKFSNFSPPLQMWMKRLCHFHPIPLCPKNFDHVGRVHILGIHHVTYYRARVVSGPFMGTSTLSGSDQSKSHRSPWSGTSVGLMIRLKVE